MLLASKTMALAGLDLFTNPDLWAEAQAEFAAAKDGKEYVTPLPEDALPQ